MNLEDLRAGSGKFRELQAEQAAVLRIGAVVVDDEKQKVLQEKLSLAEKTLKQYQVQDALEVIRVDVWSGEGSVKDSDYMAPGELGIQLYSDPILMPHIVSSFGSLIQYWTIIGLQVVAYANAKMEPILKFRENIAFGIINQDATATLIEDVKKGSASGAIGIIEPKPFATQSRSINLAKSVDPAAEFDDALYSYIEAAIERNGLPNQLREYSNKIKDALPADLKDLLEKEELSDWELRNWEYNLKGIPNWLHRPCYFLQKARSPILFP